VFSPVADRLARFHDKVSRIARRSPEGTGALAGFSVSLALTLVMMGVGAYRTALAETAAEEAKSIASQEHASQQPAILTPPAEVAPAP
jgi:hypothetical protein